MNKYLSYNNIQKSQPAQNATQPPLGWQKGAIEFAMSASGLNGEKNSKTSLSCCNTHNLKFFGLGWGSGGRALSALPLSDFREQRKPFFKKRFTLPPVPNRTPDLIGQQSLIAPFYLAFHAGLAIMPQNLSIFLEIL